MLVVLTYLVLSLMFPFGICADFDAVSIPAVVDVRVFGGDGGVSPLSVLSYMSAVSMHAILWLLLSTVSCCHDTIRNVVTCGIVILCCVCCHSVLVVVGVAVNTHYIDNIAVCAGVVVAGCIICIGCEESLIVSVVDCIMLVFVLVLCC